MEFKSEARIPNLLINIILIIQIILSAYTLRGVLLVSKLSGAERAQDVFVLIPLYVYGFPISIIAFSVGIVSSILIYSRDKVIPKKKIYLKTLLAILSPIISMIIFMFII